VRYKKGALLTSADALSRIERPVDTATYPTDDVDVEANWTAYMPTAPTASLTDIEQTPAPPISAARTDDIAYVLVPAEALHPTRVDRVNIEFDLDEQDGCIAPVRPPTLLPLLDDVRILLPHCPDFAPISEYLQYGTLP
jgi:hypothetical protein